MPITAWKSGPQVYFFCGNYPGITLKQTIESEEEKYFGLAIVHANLSFYISLPWAVSNLCFRWMH